MRSDELEPPMPFANAGADGVSCSTGRRSWIERGDSVNFATAPSSAWILFASPGALSLTGAFVGINAGKGRWFGGVGNEERVSMERTEFAFSVDAKGGTGRVKDVGGCDAVTPLGRDAPLLEFRLSG